MATRRHTTLGVVHVTTTPPGWEREAARVRAIHKAQGWSDIGYNEVINPNGRAEWAGETWLTVPMSPVSPPLSYGLSMVGGVDAKNRPDFNSIKDAQLATLKRGCAN